MRWKDTVRFPMVVLPGAAAFAAALLVRSCRLLVDKQLLRG